MDRNDLKHMVSQLLEELAQTGLAPAAEPKPAEPAATGEGCLPDITETDLRKQYLVENPRHRDAFLALKQKTPARIGVGRCGARYRTETFLRFRADHAAAQDSVFSAVPEDFAAKNGYAEVQTLCRDKDEYLTRPDLGRRFSPEAQAQIKAVCGPQPRIVLAVGDGLSSNAVMTNAPDCLAAIRQGLQTRGLETGTPLFIRFCRVGATDHIGEVTGAELVCLLVGERPGLSTSESMSAYITYRPRLGIPESSRTVVSNIHRQGTAAVEAGAHLAGLLETILKKKASGVALGREDA